MVVFGWNGPRVNSVKPGQHAIIGVYYVSVRKTLFREAFEEAFAPVARLETIRLLLAVAAKENWLVHHLDVKSAFSNGNLKEEVYVSQPTGFEVKGKEEMVYRLHKALYGLREAPTAWNAKLDEVLKDLGFSKCVYELAVYKVHGSDYVLIIGVYVDDLIVTGSSEKRIYDFKRKIEFLSASHPQTHYLV